MGCNASKTDNNDGVFVKRVNDGRITDDEHSSGSSHNNHHQDDDEEEEQHEHEHEHEHEHHHHHLHVHQYPQYDQNHRLAWSDFDGHRYDRLDFPAYGSRKHSKFQKSRERRRELERRASNFVGTKLVIRR